jgi:hypothetical protein
VDYFATAGREIAGFIGTEAGLKMYLGPEHPVTKTPRLYDVAHTIACADTFIELLHRENVRGIATEYELGPKDLDGVLFARMPDALIVVRQGQFKYRIAVEVETSLKDKSLLQGLIFKYRQAFEAPLTCDGVIIVACTTKIHRAYQAAINEVPQDLREKFALFDSVKLSGLSDTVFGVRLSQVSRALETHWIPSDGDFSEMPINSAHTNNIQGPNPPARYQVGV